MQASPPKITISMAAPVSAAIGHLIAILGILATVFMGITGLYAILLLLAVILNSGIGSPFAYPLWLLLALAFALSVCLFLGLPTVAVIEILKKRKRLTLLAQLGIIVGVNGIILVTALFELKLSAGGAAILSCLVLMITLDYWIIYSCAAWALRLCRPTTLQKPSIIAAPEVNKT